MATASSDFDLSKNVNQPPPKWPVIGNKSSLKYTFICQKGTLNILIKQNFCVVCLKYFWPSPAASPGLVQHQQSATGSKLISCLSTPQLWTQLPTIFLALILLGREHYRSKSYRQKLKYVYDWKLMWSWFAVFAQLPIRVNSFIPITISRLDI